MKNLLVFCLVLLIGCTAGEAAPEQKQPPVSWLQQNCYSWDDQVVDGMTYRVYFKTLHMSHTGYAIAVVNLTKDKLEVENLQRLTAASTK